MNLRTLLNNEKCYESPPDRTPGRLWRHRPLGPRLQRGGQRAVGRTSELSDCLICPVLWLVTVLNGKSTWFFKLLFYRSVLAKTCSYYPQQTGHLPLLLCILCFQISGCSEAKKMWPLSGRNLAFTGPYALMLVGLGTPGLSSTLLALLYWRSQLHQSACCASLTKPGFKTMSPSVQPQRRGCYKRLTSFTLLLCRVWRMIAPLEVNELGFYKCISKNFHASCPISFSNDL